MSSTSQDLEAQAPLAPQAELHGDPGLWTGLSGQVAAPSRPWRSWGRWRLGRDTRREPSAPEEGSLNADRSSSAEAPQPVLSERSWDWEQQGSPQPSTSDSQTLSRVEASEVEGPPPLADSPAETGWLQRGLRTPLGRRWPLLGGSGGRDGQQGSAASTPMAASGEASPATPLLSESDVSQLYDLEAEESGPTHFSGTSMSPEIQQQQQHSSPRRGVQVSSPGPSFTQRLAAIARSPSLSSIGYASTVGSKGSPSCLICLDPVTPDELESGEAIQLECNCRGEAALRHVACAQRWLKVKGNRICEVCNFEIQNLPAPTPPESEAAEEDHLMRSGAEAWDGDGGMPGPADYIYDFLKIVWVVMILCVLFFDLPFTKSLYIGLGAGLACIAVVRIGVAAHTAWLRRELALIGEEIREERRLRQDNHGPGWRRGTSRQGMPQRSTRTSVRMAFSP